MPKRNREVAGAARPAHGAVAAAAADAADAAAMASRQDGVAADVAAVAAGPATQTGSPARTQKQSRKLLASSQLRPMATRPVRAPVGASASRRS